MNLSIDVAAPTLHPLLARLVRETGAAVLDASTFDAWAEQAGAAMVVFVEEPERIKETLDLAVIVPELAASRPGRFRVALLPPVAARAVAKRYGFAHWPAFVMLRDVSPWMLLAIAPECQTFPPRKSGYKWRIVSVRF